jgi:hypothetical protein
MTVMPTMRRVGALLTLRISSATARTLAREARRQRKSKSEVARSMLEAGLHGDALKAGFEREARRQSLLVSRRRSEQETLGFIESAADTWGWR